MLPISTSSCSLYFTITSAVVGGLFGSLGFIANILAVRALMSAYQKYKSGRPERAAGTEPMNRADRRFIQRRKRM